LVRALRLAALSRLPSAVSLRGGQAVALRVDPGPSRLLNDGSPRATFAAVRPALLVVDDPNEAAADAWVRTARQHGCPVVGIVDAGIGTRNADLVIDGSAARPVRGLPSGRTLRGPRYAVIDPAAAIRRARARTRDRVLITLGGGRRTGYALRLAQAIVADSLNARVFVAGGFAGAPPPGVPPRVRWLGPQRSLVRWLEAASVAVVAGGITLYEACALGTPTIAAPVVEAQRPAVGALARLGAVIAPEWPAVPPDPILVAARVRMLLARRAVRTPLARKARRAVDGQGAFRVAAILRDVADGCSVRNLIDEERAKQRRQEVREARRWAKGGRRA
jgi:hypothetical protein